MLTHVVIFWADAPVEENRAKLLEGVKELKNIPGVMNFRFGGPVPSPRAAVDDSFAVAISMDFEGKDELDAYQVHPIHKAFLAEYVGTVAKRVLVYDYAA